ncbi:hypothetical protein AGABI2DRAFT_194071 [Agaricus bisporus var. bisporus H97]|uniref:hypothetical protein n=1 Tax=Agaricus bisporus var. bisporus (strain H97 / ATCC MYA-4626 / FGSC 10389) TaxID=936046 RepID=UPI00029F5922|nr:hypothetical protein AGABI2DRAFT_194071 [Agaricus bisporus var. bisporus H97]EKV44954.1 hypothetical protein AGABI2DRAFT_194071 [Agaricus bisporus var. bisporus H97]
MLLESKPLTWFITGASSGFGYRLSLIALHRGDNVLATTRSFSNIQKLIDEVDSSERKRLKVFEMQLSDDEERMRKLVKDAVGVWGGVDVLVNNAGWAWRGILEESGTSVIQRLIDENVMGTLKLTFALLPYMRHQRSGTIITIGSRSAWRTELPSIGSYAMVKASLRVFMDNLHTELSPFNIRTLLIEPGSFRTENIYATGWNTTHLFHDYDTLRQSAQEAFKNIQGNEPGDPYKAMRIVVDIVHGEGVAEGKTGWPRYLVLGSDAETNVRDKCKLMLDVLDEWEDVVKGVNFE